MKQNAARTIDRIDLKILELLQADGRITKARMSEEVGLSAPRCWERMKKLEKAKIIRGYHAAINLEQLASLSLFHTQIKLTNYSAYSSRAFRALMDRHPNILSCQSVLGDIDYILSVAAFGIQHYQTIMDELMASESASFDYVTFPITGTLKDRHRVSISDLLETAPGGDDES